MYPEYVSSSTTITWRTLFILTAQAFAHLYKWPVYVISLSHTPDIRDSVHAWNCQVTLPSPNTCCRWLPIPSVFAGKNIQTGISSRQRKTKMKHLIFHVVFSLFLRVTIWPNLFFWACHGKAAHPANTPDEVWSLHPNPVLLPSAHIPTQLSSLLEVDVTHRHSLRVRWRHPYSNLKPVRQTRDQSFITHSLYILSQVVPFSAGVTKVKEKIKGICCVLYIFYLTKQKHISLHYPELLIVR